MQRFKVSHSMGGHWIWEDGHGFMAVPYNNCVDFMVVGFSLVLIELVLLEKISIEVFCDNKFVAGSEQGHLHSKTHGEILAHFQRWCLEVSERCDVSWIGVMGHEGNVCNEVVDEVANEGRKVCWRAWAPMV